MLRSRHFRSVVRLLAAFALVAVAFGHQPPRAGAPDDLAAYALPDGSLPVICQGTGGATGGREVAGKGCDACRLTASAALPPPAASFRRRVPTGALPAKRAADMPPGRTFPPAAPPTAPPLA